MPPSIDVGRKLRQPDAVRNSGAPADCRATDHDDGIRARQLHAIF
jgi:hypothetical protein